jgi:hypothetical protein
MVRKYVCVMKKKAKKEEERKQAETNEIVYFNRSVFRKSHDLILNSTYFFSYKSERKDMFFVLLLLNVFPSC